ncbi:MAG: PQQ-binding-like beta-propeller repeat protein [Kiritimatiellae bacterium]|nr:PQQ-binding-like beta-propeller repeat protein [Kiritimatiellia bacterium]MDD5520588.1 PQQ-binding-like beta-propeller repeat protein [Kiritimatiellia bacterium]
MIVDEKSVKLSYRITYAMAVVSCVFSLLVGMLMVSSLMAVRTSSPLDMPEIDQLRAVLKENPTDEILRNKIRDLDLVSRRFYFTGLTSLRTGSFLLLGGVIIMLVSLKTMASLRRRLPNPREYPASPDMLQSAATARWVIAGMWVALITGAVVIGIMERSGLEAVVPSNGVPIKTAQPVTMPVSGQMVSTTVSPAQPVTASPDAAEVLKNWPGFRGPLGNGVSAFTNMPVSWDVKSGRGIIWKVKVPLSGMSSPVVWGNRVFLTGASETKREVYCYDIANGTLLWTARVDAAPGNTNKVPQVSKDAGYAAPTPVTDGVNVYAIFANGDITAIDFCSKKIWDVDMGLCNNTYGYSASLAIHKGKIIVQYDSVDADGKVSEMIALDAATGKKAWSITRPVADSWPSPIVAQTGKGAQLISMANEWIIAYDPVAGKELWKVKCAGSEVTPSPIYAGGLVIASIAAEQVYAIRPDGQGDVTKSHVVWRSEDGVADVSSPVSNGELVFFAHSGGTLTCIEVASGKIIWDKSLDGEFYASPGLAGDRLYLVTRNGEVFIVRAGRKYEEIGKTSLGEPSDCSPAFVDGRIIMRGATNLFCIGNK